MIVLKREDVARWAEGMRNLGMKVIFTNGVFDIYHLGHAQLMRYIHTQFPNEALVVALNSDNSTKLLKGESRPVNGLFKRLSVMDTIKGVDVVTVFGESTPLELIQVVLPDVLVKGGQYVDTDIVGASFVKSYGGVVLFGPHEEGVSTTELIRHLYEGGNAT